MSKMKDFFQDLSLYSVAVKNPPDVSRLVVRIRTCYWVDRKGLHTRKDILLMQKLSNAPDFIFEDARNGGAGEVIQRILNLNECPDGLYEIETTNVTRDWETGYADDWDYKLIPFKIITKK